MMVSYDNVLILAVVSILAFPTLALVYGVNSAYLTTVILVYDVWFAYIAIIRGMLILPNKDKASAPLEKLRAFVYLIGLPISIIGNWLPYFLGLAGNLLYLPLWVAYGMLPVYVILERVVVWIPNNLYARFRSMKTVQQEWFLELLKETASNTFPISIFAILVGFAAENIPTPRTAILFVVVALLLLPRIIENERSIRPKVRELVLDLGRRNSKLTMPDSKPINFRTGLLSLLILVTITAIPLIYVAGQISSSLIGNTSAELADFTQKIMIISAIMIFLFFIGQTLLRGVRYYGLRLGLLCAQVLLAVAVFLSGVARSAFLQGSTNTSILSRPLTFFLDAPFFLVITLIFLPRILENRNWYTRKT